ncbi:MAG: hypothetical protein OEW53_07630, partial [Actinomycetota bacterium]|nr:hypothetical protein [Actinomycetota bacterium]
MRGDSHAQASGPSSCVGYRRRVRLCLRGPGQHLAADSSQRSAVVGVVDAHADPIVDADTVHPPGRVAFPAVTA